MSVVVIKDRLIRPHFRSSEFRCRCRRPDCDAPPMKDGVLDKLEALRLSWGQPLIVTSGSRCVLHNAAIGGAHQSQHLLGNAVDLHFEDPSDTKTVALLAEKHGFGGIGTGVHLLHLDDRGHPARWSYDI